jgi:hypothetical protein
VSDISWRLAKQFDAPADMLPNAGLPFGVVPERDTGV